MLVHGLSLALALFGLWLVIAFPPSLLSIVGLCFVALAFWFRPRFSKKNRNPPLWLTFTPQERVAVLAHELAHDVNDDVRRSLFVGGAIDALARMAWS